MFDTDFSVDLDLFLDRRRADEFCCMFDACYVPLRVDQVTFYYCTSFLAICSRLTIFGIDFSDSIRLAIRYIMFRRMYRMVGQTGIIGACSLGVTSLLDDARGRASSATRAIGACFGRYGGAFVNLLGVLLVSGLAWRPRKGCVHDALFLAATGLIVFFVMRRLKRRGCTLWRGLVITTCFFFLGDFFVVRT